MRTCPTCRDVLDGDGPCAFCATTCWFCDQPRDQHEEGCPAPGMEAVHRAKNEHLREEGRREERARIVAALRENRARTAQQLDEVSQGGDVDKRDHLLWLLGVESALQDALAVVDPESLQAELRAAVEADEHLKPAEGT